MSPAPTPTPRTDAAKFHNSDVVHADFARELERELAALKQEQEKDIRHFQRIAIGGEIRANRARIEKEAAEQQAERLAGALIAYLEGATHTDACHDANSNGGTVGECYCGLADLRKELAAWKEGR